VANDVDPLFRAARDRSGRKEAFAPLDHVQALDAEGLTRSDDRRTVVRIVWRIENYSYAREPRLDDGTEALSAPVGHEWLQHPHDLGGLERIGSGELRGDELVGREHPWGPPSHGGGVYPEVAQKRAKWAAETPRQYIGRPPLDGRPTQRAPSEPPMLPDRASTQLPPVPRRRRRRDWGSVVAFVFCCIFATFGVLPVALAMVVRSDWARRWVEREAGRALRERGVEASYRVELRLWPLALELRGLQVASSDHGPPLVTSPRVSVRPKLFALLSGKLAIDQIEVDAPRLRAVVRDGKLTNLAVNLPESRSGGGRFHAPFNVVSVADAQIDLDIDGVTATAREVDVDVTADDDPEQGSSFEMAVRAGEAALRRVRPVAGAGESVDEDMLCSIDARFRVEPHDVLVRRLTASGSADLDPATGSRPACHLADDDKRKVELAFSHLRVSFPDPKGSAGVGAEGVHVDGHVRGRAPVELAARFAPIPKIDGWVGLDADVRYGDDTPIPEASGHFEAHALQLDRYRFAQEIQSDFVAQRNVVTSKQTTVRFAEGVVTLTEVKVDPLGKGVPLSTKLDASSVDFTALLRDLAVNPRAHVGWDIRDVHVPTLTGTLVPLHIDGDLTGTTGGFEVDDSPHEDAAHARIIGVKEALLRAHVSVTPDAVQFKAVQVKTPKSTLENGFVSLGYRGDLRVDVPKGQIDLADLTPLATIPIAGQVGVEAHVSGTFSIPHLEGDAQIKDFVFGDIPFGTVSAAHASLSGMTLDLKNVKATKGKSNYEMPTARLEFGGRAAMTMDAQVASGGLNVRDFLSIWKMDDDPRLSELDGALALRGSVHVALGGPEDVCGDGLFDVRATTHATNLTLFGEEFDDGDADLEYRWVDRLAGVEGAEIDVRSINLHKGHAAGGDALGSVLGSGSVARGGVLNGSVVLQAVPLSRMQTLGSVRNVTEGAVSGALQLGGTLDAYSVHGDVDVTPIRVHGAEFGPSHLRVAMTQNPPTAKPVGRTRCQGAIFPAFDREAYLRDTSSQGTFTVDGEAAGGQVRLDRLTMTRQASPELSGKLAFRNLDVGAVVTALRSPQGAGEEAPGSVSANAVDGQLSGDLTIDRLVTTDLARASVRFKPSSLVVSRAGVKVALHPSEGALTLADDVLTLPPSVLDLSTPNGLKGAATVQGSISDVSRSPTLGITAQLAPIDLGVLVGVVPKLERSQGTLSGSVAVKGRLAQPQIAGEVHVKGGDFGVHGLPGDISEVELDAVANAAELKIAHGTAKFAGGTLAVQGSMPLKSFAFDQGEATIAARDIHIAPAEGISTTFDADLVLSLNGATAGGAAGLPHVGGDVLVTSFDYTRNMNLELNAFGVKSKRTNVETYDPSLDSVVFDGVRVRTRVPVKIRNNLIEVQLAVDSGALTVTGTDQRVGLRGELHALPGGRFHLRANDFEVRQGLIRFEDPTRIAPNVDVLAVTEYRRYTDTSAAAAAGAAGGTAGGTGIWRISLHAYGDTENLRIELTSDPPLSQEDIVLLLTIGMTRAEVDQLQAGSLGASAALEALATVSGADRAVKTAIPVIDDFRFGSAYSTLTGRTEPQVIVGKRLTDNLRANVATTLAEDREIRSNIEWRLSQQMSVQGTYDNINDVSSSSVGNVGIDFRWRIEFK
jgi:translocation and assembly module TamB